jgi:hypothetical protein
VKLGPNGAHAVQFVLGVGDHGGVQRRSIFSDR